MENSSNEYLLSLLEKYKTNNSDLQTLIDKLRPIINQWAQEYGREIILMGSVGQGTSIQKEFDRDVDLLLSMRTDTPFNCEELFNSLFNFLKKKNFKIKKRNISQRINVNGINFDLVPGIKEPGNTHYHKIWSKRENKELRTNVQMHEDIVNRANRKKEIMLTRIWAFCNNISFDGFYLTLSVIEALKGAEKDNLPDNMYKILKYLATKWESKVFVDPARPSDIVNENMEPEERKKVVRLAEKSLRLDNWNDILW